MKKRLNESQFQDAIAGLKFNLRSNNTKVIAHGVLVRGLPQSHFVKEFKLTKGAVSQAVNRVWRAHQTNLPAGFERVNVVLTVDEAMAVKQLARATAKTMEAES